MPTKSLVNVGVTRHFEEIQAQKLNIGKLSQKLIFGPILAIFLKMTNSKHNSEGLFIIHDVANSIHAAWPVYG